MKNLYVAFFILIFAFLGAQGQTRVYFTGGPHQARVNETNNIPDWQQNTGQYFKGLNSFHIGLQAEIPFSQGSNFFFQPGVSYYGRGRNYQQSFDTAASTNSFYKSTLNTDYIDIPMHLGLKLSLSRKVKFVMSAGTVISIFYNGKFNDETYPKSGSVILTSKILETGNTAEKYSTVTAGVSATAGLDFGALFLKADYTHGLTDFYKASYDGSFRHQTIGATIGIRIFQEKSGSKSRTETEKDDPAPMVKKEEKLQIKDRDKDGVPDDIDECPDDPGPARTKGCPDRDGDGIPDKDDECPDDPGPANTNGCPDRDGDGVPDKDDKCPDVPGPKSNFGCPVVKEEVVQRINRIATRINFEFGSIDINRKYFADLDEVVAIMKKDTALHLTIEGHSDNVGSAERIKIVSGQRAAAIKAYIVGKGIAEHRLTAIGYGAERPIADNNTDSGRAKNRRVEFKVRYR